VPNIVVVGAQWGDEGKGKIVDLLSEHVQVVARYNGGHNAGHTVRIADKEFVLHLVPSGILHPGVLCVMGHGMVIDPWALESEVDGLVKRGVEIDENLIVADRAHLILPHHRILESAAEDLRGTKKIGTTNRGIGPAYEDKAGRRGVRMGDLLRPDSLKERLGDARAHFERIRCGEGRDTSVDWGALEEQLLAFGERFRTRITDVSAALHRHMAQGYSVLFEGAQATLLDLDLGTYPYVTSSSAGAGGVGTGLGVAPTRIDGVLGIAKAYTTRVGTGPLPTQLGGSLEDAVRKKGHEFGSSTGRPRRCGWFDATVVRYSVRVNGFDSIALTKLDVLDDLPEIKICTGYRSGGVTLEDFPADVSILDSCEPIYETLPGWRQSTAGIRDFQALPLAARRYVDRLSELVGSEIGIVSTGPDREDTHVQQRGAIAAWFGL
jgi:adenylosuccinate synthase